MASNPSRRKLLEELVPEGIIVSRKWIKQESGLSNHTIDNLIKSEQLKLLWKGLYTRGVVSLTWQSVIYTLQHILQTDFIIGGLTALELKGFSHYVTNSSNVKVHLYGNDKLPIWTKEILKNDFFVKHTRAGLFDEMDKSLSEKYTSIIPWKDNMGGLKISTPERACLEMLNQVPHSISFEHADQLIQGMTALSPRTLQVLLEMCSNIKVKRLFLWFAKRHNYVWFNKLNLEKIDLGSGKRVIEKGGELDKDYLITVPKDFEI
ncbi:MAG TPA: type IV toxin-antitoxin system AbiEi family antitoxin domain-containing protein [Chitinophagales bacterium]|nr:type IV toxin-antitoxin system AbiEi family antitoxin domain-containing protein [Chitinophagales bacterium]